MSSDEDDFVYDDDDDQFDDGFGQDDADGEWSVLDCTLNHADLSRLDERT